MKKETYDELIAIKYSLIEKLRAVNVVLEMYDAPVEQKVEIKEQNVSLDTDLRKLTKLQQEILNRKPWQYAGTNWCVEIENILQHKSKPVILKDLTALWPVAETKDKSRVVNGVSAALATLARKKKIKKSTYVNQKSGASYNAYELIR